MLSDSGNAAIHIVSFTLLRINRQAKESDKSLAAESCARISDVLRNRASCIRRCAGILLHLTTNICRTEAEGGNAAAGGYFTRGMISHHVVDFNEPIRYLRASISARSGKARYTRTHRRVISVPGAPDDVTRRHATHVRGRQRV